MDKGWGVSDDRDGGPCRYLVDAIRRHLGRIKKIIKGNMPAIEEIMKNYHAEAACDQTLAKFMNLPELIESVCVIGNISFLREMLHESLKVRAFFGIWVQSLTPCRCLWKLRYRSLPRL